MTLRDRLRDATSQIHQALHAAAPFARIAAGDMDRVAYIELLSFLYRYHGAMSDACSQAAIRLGALVLAAAQDARLEALKADLAVFGCVPSPVGATAPRTDDFAVGVLYTVLGSTLGGKVIHRQLETLLADGPGRSFFKGSAGDGANWQLFCRRLEDAGLDMGQVEAGALHAFATFQSMLNEPEFAVACE